MPPTKGEETKAVEHLFRTDSRLFYIFQLQGGSAVFFFRCDVPLRRTAIITPARRSKMPQSRLSLIGRTTESLGTKQKLSGCKALKTMRGVVDITQGAPGDRYMWSRELSRAHHGSEQGESFDVG